MKTEEVWHAICIARCMTSGFVRNLAVLLSVMVSSGCVEESTTYSELWLSPKDDLSGTFLYRELDEKGPRRVVLELEEEALRVLEVDHLIEGGGRLPLNDVSLEPLQEVAVFPVIAHLDIIHIYDNVPDCTIVDWTTHPWEERWLVAIDWDSELLGGGAGELTLETPDETGSAAFPVHGPIAACTIGGEPLPDTFFH